MDQVLFGYQSIVKEISDFRWEDLSEADMTATARAYYYFSVQFRENLQLACQMYPADPLLAQLLKEECDTANLSPWPGVALAGERMDHDEFMRRLLDLPGSTAASCNAEVDGAGQRYLAAVRVLGEVTRAASIGTYEDGGLETVFTAMLRAQHWDTKLLQAFRHFLEKHISFDSDVEGGHGAMVRHLAVSAEVCDIWSAFRDLLVEAAPALVE